MQEHETLDWVNREGRERAAPSIANPSWLVLARRRELFRHWIQQLPASNLSVLDLGGRIQPYRPMLGDQVRHYVALDLHRSPLVNVVASGEQLPLPDSSFDLVICTKVLQYVSSPEKLIEEARRVLRPGGHLFLSAPAIFPRDSERDLWRFTSAGLASLLSSFHEVAIAPEGYSISGMGRTVALMTTFAPSAFMRKLLGATVVPVINVGTAALESLVGSSNDQFTVNFSAFARK